MCGISCYFSKRNYKNQLLESLKTLDHRGPDASTSLFLNHGEIGLGHTRLSIVDLFGGHQPLSNEQGDIFCVVNGEFYEYKKIRHELIQKGYKFRTNSDSEILIPLYQEYGLNLFEHLIGEFAFVLYDCKKSAFFAQEIGLG